jgi:hypothetical protein
VARVTRHLGPISLSQTNDYGVLRRKVAVEIAGAHAGFDRDILHGRAVKACAHEPALSGIEDAGATLA